MKISAQSHTAIVSAIQKALENYATPGKQGVATDIYFQPDMVSGELTIYNDAVLSVVSDRSTPM